MKNIAVSLVLAGMLWMVPTAAIAFAQDQTRITEEGLASWYGGEFHGRQTANGEIFDTNLLTAAHRTLPFGTMALVTNLDSGKSVTVRINDRGPFVAGRSIDVSKAAAEELGLISSGVARVRIEATLPLETVKALASAAPADNKAQEKAVVFLGVKPLAEIDSGMTPLLHTIQVASFGVAANADKLVTLLKQHGLNPETENLADTGRIRVVLRSVSEPGLASALTQLKGLGFDQVIVRPQ